MTSESKLKALQNELDLKSKEIELIMTIDAIRDNVSEPAAMLAAAIKVLAEHLHADMGLLFLLDRRSGSVELKAVYERSQQWSQLSQVITRELAERAVHLPKPLTWQARDVFSPEVLTEALMALYLMATPVIFKADERLGAIILARFESPFSTSETQLLKTAEDQIDSVIVQGYLQEKLKQDAKELETIFRIDHIRDQGLSLDDMLTAVIQELSVAIEAEIGFIMLYDRAGKKLEMRASTHWDLLAQMPYFNIVNQAVNDSLERAELICLNNGSSLGEELRSVMCLPLILNEQIIGVLGVANRYNPRGFTSADRRLLMAIGSQIDTAIYERREIRMLREILGRSIDPHVMDRLLANADVGFLKGELLELTVLYADIRGSTHLAETTEPAILVEFIKDYLTHMTNVILKQEGTVDKFVGDEVMALFGAPVPLEDHALRAVQVGLDMQVAYQEVKRHWQERGLTVPPIGIGIATGEMTAGEMGSPQRTNYTVIGRAVNLGARICAAALGDQVLISQRTYELTKDKLEVIPLPGQKFKGVGDDVAVYHVIRVIDRGKVSLLA
jgi:class 3 adenylate cyclase